MHKLWLRAFLPPTSKLTNNPDYTMQKCYITPPQTPQRERKEKCLASRISPLLIIRRPSTKPVLHGLAEPVISKTNKEHKTGLIRTHRPGPLQSKHTPHIFRSK